MAPDLYFIKVTGIFVHKAENITLSVESDKPYWKHDFSLCFYASGRLGWLGNKCDIFYMKKEKRVW